VIVLVELVDVPPAAGGGDPSTGAWLALAGAFLMAAGAALSLAAISVTVQVRERDVRRRVPAVDRRGATDDDADLAEDLDADAEGPVGEGRSASLFSGLGRRGDDDGDDVLGDTPPQRTGRFAPREPGRSDAGDLERTQPLSGLPDAGEEDAERP
jgi:hypothetical protein